MRYPRNCQVVRTNAYFLPAFDGMDGWLDRLRDRQRSGSSSSSSSSGGSSGDVPLTSKAIKGDLIFQRDMEKLRPLQAHLAKSKEVRLKLNAKYPKINGMKIQAAKVVGPIKPAFAGTGIDLSPSLASIKKCEDSDSHFAHCGFVFRNSMRARLDAHISDLKSQIAEATRAAQESANTAVERQLIDYPYKTHIISGRFDAGRDVVVFDVTKDGEMVQKGVSDVAGAKGVIDNEVVKRQEEALAQADQERIAAQQAADQQGPPTRSRQEIEDELTRTGEPGQQGPTGGRMPNGQMPGGAGEKKSNLPLILGAGAAGVAALILMK